MLDGVLIRPDRHQETRTDKIDRLLTHRVWGTLVFAAAMFVLFASIFVLWRPVMDWIPSGFQSLGEAIKSHMAEGALRSLVVDGIIGGVGASRLSAADLDSVHVHRAAGRLRLHGPGGVF